MSEPRAPSSAAPPLALPDGVLHGALLRPPVLRWDGQHYGGARLQALAELEVPPAQALPGVVAVVRQQHFVGVVAVAAVLARQAADSLRPVWQMPATAEPPAAPECEGAAGPDASAYVWRLPPRAPSGGAGATAWCVGGHATVWAPCAPAGEAALRDELARLLGLPAGRITVAGTDPGPAGGLHPLDVLDAAADAALLSQAVGRPVRVAVDGPGPGSGAPGELLLAPMPAAGGGPAQGWPEDQPEGQPKWAAPDGSAPRPPRAGAPPPVQLRTASPWAVRPSLARLLSAPGAAGPSGRASARGAQVAGPPRPAPAAPLAHAGARELDAAQVFAQESLIDERAAQCGCDPLAYRLAGLPPGPGRRLAEQMGQRLAGLAAPGREPPLAPQGREGAADALPGGQAPVPAPAAAAADGRLHGRGYASAHVSLAAEAAADGAAGTEAWSAWIAEVAVEPATGRIDVTRVVVGHDSQDLRMAQGAAIRSQDPRLLDAARQLLAAPARFDDWGRPAPAGTGQPVAPVAGGDGALAAASPASPMAFASGAAEPVARGRLAADGVLTLPAAAAIANAIFDATGVRLRQVPFDGEQLRLALQQQPAGPGAPAARRWLRRGAAWLAAGASAVAGLLAMTWPAKAPIAPTAGPDVSLYSAAAIERGRLVAAAGDCIVCHTAPGGPAHAGGLGLETPFGTIYSTNITPDNETGIGRWSYSAFERAMREGVHRDGRQLYPAFPYTAFARMTDADLQALYAYLLAQPPVRSEPPRTELAFPYSLRPAMAGWNLLFHDNRVYRPDPTQSLEWNRGAYLVQGAGHCAACHSPRNALGAEKTGLGNYLAGGQAEGWDAPPLDRLAAARVPWTQDDLYQYLRTGYSARHGVAAGPMAPVIHGLAELPESDVRAIAAYLMNLPGAAPAEAAGREGVGARSAAAAAAAVARAGAAAATPASSSPQPTASPASAGSESAPAPSAMAAAPVFQAHVDGERLYQNACAVCHEAGTGPTLFGVKPLLAANTSLHGETPDNLIQVILNGIQAPANGDLGYMPGFRDSLDDAQVADLLGYLRARFAPGQPPWQDGQDAVARVRRAHAPQAAP